MTYTKNYQKGQQNKLAALLKGLGGTAQDISAVMISPVFFMAAQSV